MIYENVVWFAKDTFPFNSSYIPEDHPSNKNVDHHCHKETEIVMLLTGKVDIIYNQKTYKLHGGDIMIIPPFMSHALINPSRDCSRIIFLIDFAVISIFSSDHVLEYDLSFTKLFHEIENYSRNWPEIHRKAFVEFLYEMHYEYMAKNHAWEVAIMILACKLILVCLRDIPRVQTDSKADRHNDTKKILLILKYITFNLNNRISLQECADKLGLSSPYVSRLFKKCTGITIQEYVKRIRIEKAKVLLLSSRKSITEICYEAGFTDISTFNKLFKSSVGLSPTRYRKENTDSVCSNS